MITASQSNTMGLSDRINPFSPDPDLKIWIDGELFPSAEARISVFDHGLLYGDGVFEGIRVYGGEIFKEEEHVDRIFESSRAILLDLPMSRDELKGAMREAMAANSIVDGYIRLIVTRGVGLLGISIDKAACPTVIIIAASIQLYPPELYARGLHCMTSGTLRNHPSTTSARVKSLNYLNNILAKIEVNRAGAGEGLMLNQDGNVAEATGDNIFLVEGERVITPPVHVGALAGITRACVLELAAGLGLECAEQIFTLTNVYAADECFLTGTGAEVIPVVRVDGRQIGDGRPGPVTWRLIKAFRRLVRTEGADIEARISAVT